MDFLYQILDSSEMPVVTAFVLGLLTAISPCPLATNVTAVGYIARNCMKDENRVISRNVMTSGVLYTLGRALAYTTLGAILIYVIRMGADTFGLQQTISVIGEKILGPALIIIGILMLCGSRLNLPKFGFNGNASEQFANVGGSLILGFLFALAFCPTSALFFFGMLIPMSVESTAGYILPLIFAIATALPVLFVAWIIAFCMKSMSKVMSAITTFQVWLNRIVAFLFIGVGLFYSFTMYA